MIKENADTKFANLNSVTPTVVVTKGCGCGSSVNLGPTYQELLKEKLRKNISQRKLFL
jgi:hypothetical protein